MGGENYYYPVVLEDGKMVLKENLYVTDWITEQSLNFLTQRNQEKPFYLAVNYTAPHSPWSARNHPKEYIDLYKDLSLIHISVGVSNVLEICSHSIT